MFNLQLACGLFAEPVHDLAFDWRHIINPPLMPGMAFPQPLDGQPSPPDRPMRIDGLARIGRAGRVKPALRAEEGRQQQAVGVDQQDQQFFHVAGQYSPAPNCN